MIEEEAKKYHWSTKCFICNSPFPEGTPGHFVQTIVPIIVDAENGVITHYYYVCDKCAEEGLLV